MITDRPYEEATALHVMFTEVKVHRSDGEGGWLSVPFAGDPAASSRTCDLKKLEEGAQDILGVGSLVDGHYTQLRLVVAASHIYFGGVPSLDPACAEMLTPPAGFESSEALEIPSGEVKLIHPFELISNGTTTIELDFDGAQSVHETGNGRHKMSPVIRILSVQ